MIVLYTNLLSALMALVQSIPTVDGVNVRFKLPASNTFLEVAEDTARAREIMAAAENADKLEDNTRYSSITQISTPPEAAVPLC